MKRRRWLGWGGAQCLGCVALAHAQSTLPVAPAASDPSGWSMPQRFEPPDPATDEGGLWALMDREERRIRRSPFRIADAGLGSYLSAIACKLGAAHCPDIRVHLIRAPYFNASMAPNGMMQIWSGLLLRVDNEAQLAAVIGHEIGHYLLRHTVERLRDIKSRAAFAQFMGLFGVVGLVGQLAAMAGALAFSRDQEREADQLSIRLLRAARYDPREAAVVWGNLLDELRANPHFNPAQDSVLFATHPPSDERRDSLQALAAGGVGESFEAEYRTRLAPIRAELLEDELKRGRPHESVALLGRLLRSEPDHALLLHFRGEAYRQRGAAGDDALALADLLAAVRIGDAPATTHRALGQLYTADGQSAAAREAWRRYLALAPEAPDAAMIRQRLEEMSR